MGRGSLMSQVVATIALAPDPGSRFVLATYHGWFGIQVGTQELNVSIKQNGVPLTTARWLPGDPTNFRVELMLPINIGAQGGNTVYTAELDWGTGGGGQAVNFADAAFNRLSVAAWAIGV
jgi:hypothetical protein